MGCPPGLTLHFYDNSTSTLNFHCGATFGVNCYIFGSRKLCCKVAALLALSMLSTINVKREGGREEVKRKEGSVLAGNKKNA